MTRKTPYSSRNAGPTETEIALKWELNRLRSENSELRKANDKFSRQGGYLPPPERGVLIRKIANMWRHSVLRSVQMQPRCPHCHGWTEEQAEDAFEAWAQQLEAEVR